MKRWLSIFGFLLVFKCLAAMEVGFAEADYAVGEDEGSIRIVLTVTGQVEKDSGVTLEVVPMTLSEYQNMTGALPSGVRVDNDPAEPDLDFNSTSHTVSVKLQRIVFVYIDIINDEVSEMEEVFVLHLRDVTDRTGGEAPDVTIRRDVSAVFITQPISKRANIRLSTPKVTVTEGDSAAAMDHLFIELDKPIELEVSVRLILQYNVMVTKGDLEVATVVTIPANTTRRVPIPIRILDDHIAEEEECITVLLGHSTQTLYIVDRYPGHGNALVCIRDNDVPRLGIRQRGNDSTEVVEEDVIELMEGETRELCVVLLEPEDCTMYISGNVSLSPDTPTDVVFFEEQWLDLSSNLHCFEVTALDNSGINLPVTVQLDIHTQIFFNFHLQSGGDRVLTEPGLLSIRDNDGVPLPPEEVNLQFADKEVHVSWVAKPSKLQPVDKFVVVVQATPIRGIIRTCRVLVPSLAPGEIWEYETSETNLVLRIADTSKSYTILVCSVNSLGRMCSRPLPITREQMIRGRPSLMAAGVEASAEGSSKSSSEALSFPLVITIAVVVPVMLLVLCILVISVVIMCKCCGTSREYSPSRQEKAVLGNVAFVNAKYTQCDTSSTSSVSMEWTDTEPYRKTSTPNKPPNNTNSVVLGTPV